MSAQHSGALSTPTRATPTVGPASSAPPRSLRSVPTPAPRMARFPYILILMAVFGVGMAGLLMLNTTLQNQAFEARTLHRQATELTYRQSDLEDQLAGVGAPQELARRASDLGLRPNPYPALLVMPKGKVVGPPKPITGHEVPYLVVKSPEQLKAEKAARKAARMKAEAKAEAKAKAKAKAKKAEAKAEAKAQASAKKKAGR